MNPSIFLFVGKSKWIYIDIFEQQKTITNLELSNLSNALDFRPDIIQRNINLKDFLGDEEFAKFIEAEDANNLSNRNYIDNNLINHEIMYDFVFIPELNENFDVEVGYRTHLGDGVHPSAVQPHPDYLEWLQKIPSNLLYSNNIQIS